MIQTTLVLDGEAHSLEILGLHPCLRVRLDGRVHQIEAVHRGARGTQLLLDGQAFDFVAVCDESVVHLRVGGRTLQVELPDPRDAQGASQASGDAIVADMPGTVVRVAVAEGDAVQAGQFVLTIESMKLQMNLAAPREGRVARILVQANQSFERGARLVELHDAEGA